MHSGIESFSTQELICGKNLRAQVSMALCLPGIFRYFRTFWGLTCGNAEWQLVRAYFLPRRCHENCHEDSVKTSSLGPRGLSFILLDILIVTNNMTQAPKMFCSVTTSALDAGGALHFLRTIKGEGNRDVQYTESVCSGRSNGPDETWHGCVAETDILN